MIYIHAQDDRVCATYTAWKPALNCVALFHNNGLRYCYARENK